MPAKLNIAVPNIASLLATYDVIRVFRSTVSRDGPWTEVTSSAAQPATLLGSVVEPYTSLNGKTLIFRVTTEHGVRPDIAVTFTAADPSTAAQAAAAVNAQAAGILVGADDGGKLRVTTAAAGKHVKLQVVGGTAIGDLGLPLYVSDTGEDPYVQLVSGDTSYEFLDPMGSDSDWYSWQFYHTGTMASSGLQSSVQPNNPKIDPTRKVEDQRSARGLTLLRGREHVFRMAFWEDQEAGIPLVPFDAGRYPSYAIFDPNGNTIQTGKAEVDGQTPNYKASFTPSADAMLSNDDRRWRVDWFMLTEHGRPVQASEIFDVRDPDVTESEIKEQKYLAMDGEEMRVRIALPKRPVSISLQVRDANNKSDALLALPAVYPPAGPNPSITEVQDGDRYVYLYDIPAGAIQAGPNGRSYNAVWTVRESTIAANDFLIQTVECPPFEVLQYIPALRMQMDKFSKPRNFPQAYQDSDIVEYLRRGLQWVNGYDPIHLSWQLNSVPGQIQPYWLLASMWWGLNAQQGLEIDLQFGFSGQSITLDYEHASALDAWSSKVKDALDTGIPKLKKQMYRRSSAVGAYSGRALRRSGLNNYVFQISADKSNSAGGGNAFMGLLLQIGLI